MTPQRFLTNFMSPYLLLKEKSSKIFHSYIYICYIDTLSKKIQVSLNLIFYLRGVIDTAETEFADFRSQYLGNYEAI
jgi:hypothetical protein